MPPAPPWKPLLQHQLTYLTPTTFTLATLSSGSPRVRTMIYRGFLGSIPPNPHTAHHPASNPPRDSSSLTFTTDARTSKARELAASPLVEACFWISATTAEGTLNNQWRVRGKCVLLAEGDEEMGCALMGASEEWCWGREFRAHWINLAPAMRGSFNNPIPGTPVSGGEEGGRKGLVVADSDVLKEGGEEEAARNNMRVGVIVPERVERVDLEADGKKARRWVWEREGEGEGETWKEEELWP